MAEYESDSGDISLSVPSSSSSTLPSPRAPCEAPSLTPQRLFGKNLWTSSHPNLNLASSQSVSPIDDGPITPLAGPSSRVLEHPRSSSARPGDDSNTTPTPRMSNRRTSSSSSITRSRSLNVRVDLSASPPSRGPASATTRTPSTRLGWSRRPGEARPPPLVNEEVSRKMSRWVKEIVVCNFDLERGPVVERRALGRRWGSGEKENV